MDAFIENICFWVPVVHTCNPGYSGGRDQKAQGSKPEPGQIVHATLSPKYPKQNMAGGVVEHLPSKCAAVNSNPSITKKKIFIKLYSI
jgi:hypothetical protein